MATFLDPHNLPERKRKTPIPGLKPPVTAADFTRGEEFDPKEVDDFNRMIRELRNEGAPPKPSRQYRTP